RDRQGGKADHAEGGEETGGTSGVLERKHRSCSCESSGRSAGGSRAYFRALIAKSTSCSGVARLFFIRHCATSCGWHRMAVLAPKQRSTTVAFYSANSPESMPSSMGPGWIRFNSSIY